MSTSRFALAALVFAFVSCHIPDISNIHLSSCINDCNDVVKACLDDANVKLTACDPADDLCREQTVLDSESCLTTCLDCIDSCVADTEATLKD